MQYCQYLISRTPLAISDENNRMISESLIKICKYLENDINENGGILGIPLKIDFIDIPKGEEGSNLIVNHLVANPNTFALNSHSMVTGEKQLVEKLDLENFLLFSVLQQLSHKHVIDLSKFSRLQRTQIMNQILRDIKPSQVFFFHQKTRMFNHLEQLNTGLDVPVSSLQLEKDHPDTELDQHLTGLRDDAVLVFDVGLSNLLKISNILNRNNFKGTAYKFFGSIDGRIEKITFDLVEVQVNPIARNLEFDSIMKLSGVNLTNEENSLFTDSIWRLEPILLLSKLKSAKEVHSKKDLIKNCIEAINEIDGERDIHIGLNSNFAFKDNENTYKHDYYYRFPNVFQENSKLMRVFSKYQYSFKDEKIHSIPVTYVNFDILRVLEVNIDQGYWLAEFHLDINSFYDEAFDKVIFNNLNTEVGDLNCKLLLSSKTESGEYSFRYLVHAAFDFNAEVDLYPFDLQYVYISYSITSEDEYGIIQPIPDDLLDKEFHISGWEILNNVSGIIKSKEQIFQDSDFTQKVFLSEELKVGWVIKRTNNLIMYKVAIPMFFLAFIVYYSTFLPYDDNISIEFLTTAFLSAIALYFSTERPQPQSISMIDKIFQFYYILNGVVLIATGLGLLLSPEIFSITMKALQVIVPLSLTAFLLYLGSKVKSGLKKILFFRR